METNLKKVKSCVDCGRPINFKEFCQINSSLNGKDVEELYFNPIISIYCPSCFFQRPEKPFKKKPRNLAYYSKIGIDSSSKY